jgi:hypothetical protein
MFFLSEPFLCFVSFFRVWGKTGARGLFSLPAFNCKNNFTFIQLSPTARLVIIRTCALWRKSTPEIYSMLLCWDKLSTNRALVIQRPLFDPEVRIFAIGPWTWSAATAFVAQFGHWNRRLPAPLSLIMCTSVFRSCFGFALVILVVMAAALVAFGLALAILAFVTAAFSLATLGFFTPPIDDAAWPEVLVSAAAAAASEEEIDRALGIVSVGTIGHQLYNTR